jgi:hypothetical protein
VPILRCSQNNPASATRAATPTASALLAGPSLEGDARPPRTGWCSWARGELLVAHQRSAARPAETLQGVCLRGMSVTKHIYPSFQQNSLDRMVGRRNMNLPRLCDMRNAFDLTKHVYCFGRIDGTG